MHVTVGFKKLLAAESWMINLKEIFLYFRAQSCMNLVTHLLRISKMLSLLPLLLLGRP